jgi:hypothetical protein
LARHDSLFSEIPPAHAGLVGHQEKAMPRLNQTRQRRADAGQQGDAGRFRKVMLILNERAVPIKKHRTGNRHEKSSGKNDGTMT